MKLIFRIISSKDITLKERITLENNITYAIDCLAKGFLEKEEIHDGILEIRNPAKGVKKIKNCRNCNKCKAAKPNPQNVKIIVDDLAQERSERMEYKTSENDLSIIIFILKPKTMSKTQTISELLNLEREAMNRVAEWSSTLLCRATFFFYIDLQAKNIEIFTPEAIVVDIWEIMQSQIKKYNLKEAFLKTFPRFTKIGLKLREDPIVFEEIK